MRNTLFWSTTSEPTQRRTRPTSCSSPAVLPCPSSSWWPGPSTPCWHLPTSSGSTPGGSSCRRSTLKHFIYQFVNIFQEPDDWDRDSDAGNEVRHLDFKLGPIVISADWSSWNTCCCCYSSNQGKTICKTLGRFFLRNHSRIEIEKLWSWKWRRRKSQRLLRWEF